MQIHVLTSPPYLNQITTLPPHLLHQITTFPSPIPRPFHDKSGQTFGYKYNTWENSRAELKAQLSHFLSKSSRLNTHSRADWNYFPKALSLEIFSSCIFPRQ